MFRSDLWNKMSIELWNASRELFHIEKTNHMKCYSRTQFIIFIWNDIIIFLSWALFFHRNATSYQSTLMKHNFNIKFVFFWAQKKPKISFECLVKCCAKNHNCFIGAKEWHNWNHEANGIRVEWQKSGWCNEWRKKYVNHCTLI